MDTQLQELRDDRKEAVSIMRSLADKWEAEGTTGTEEEVAQYEAADEKQEELKRQIEKLERVNKIKSLNLGGGNSRGPVIKVSRKATERDNNNAFKAWALGGCPETLGDIRDDWKRSADLVGVDYTSKSFKRDQSSDVNGEGDDFLNDSMYKGHVEAQAAFGGMLEAGNVINVATSEVSHYAIDNDTAALAATHAENVAVTNVGVTVDRVSVTPAIYSSGVFPVSLQLIQNSHTDIGAWVGRKLSRRILAKVNAALTAVLDAGVTSGTTGYSTLTDSEDLIDLYFSVDSYYRNSAKTVFMGNDAMLAQLVGNLTDTTGQPTWGNGLRDVPGNSILGKRWITNQDCDTPSAGVQKQPIFFGDFENFMIHTVGASPSFHRLNELYMENLAVGFVAHWQVGSALVDAGTNPIKCLTTGTISGDN